MPISAVSPIHLGVMLIQVSRTFPIALAEERNHGKLTVPTRRPKLSSRNRMGLNDYSSKATLQRYAYEVFEYPLSRRYSIALSAIHASA